MGKHWLDEAIERYGNDQNNGRDPYPIDRYEYKWGGNGEDTNGNDKLEFDCSHFVNRVLRDAGYNIPYQSTPEMAKNYSKYYEEVDPNDIQKGDIVLFYDPKRGIRHVGFYYGKDRKGRDLIYNSSGSDYGRGPSINPMSWWGKPFKILRPKKEFYNGQKQSSVWDFFKNFFVSSAYAEETRDKIREGSRRIDPLVIDLDGDGIKLVNINKSNAMFDLTGSGFANKTGWISSGDAFFVWDRNNNGRIDDISEMFGSANQSGFKALALYDTNRDGRIDAFDDVFKNLKLWQDRNGDGRTDEGELLNLSDWKQKIFDLIFAFN